MAILRHKDANIKIEELSSGKKRIIVELLNKELFMNYSTWETSYPYDLIEKILEIKGPAWLCDEIMRDESPNYVQKSLKHDLLSYVNERKFKDKRILDFGCGSGASTMILGRMFPHSEIVGVELDKNLLSIAKLRNVHYGFIDRIELLLSPDENSLPKDINKFDFIVISAVFEHLLPDERKILLPKLWNLLESEGVLFINQTPYRYFPTERHTTSGLPAINYLPDKATCFIARHFSKRNLKNDSWETLLRKGIRGGSVREVLSIIKHCEHKPMLLIPSELELKDRIDLWYLTNPRRSVIIKKTLLMLYKLIKLLTGIIFLKDLSLAIRKSSTK